LKSLNLNALPGTIVRGTNPKTDTVAVSSIATLLTNNVVHFTVQVLTNNNVGGVIDADFRDVPGNRDFDTGATPTPTYQVFALQISIRVWDPKTQQSRQITIVQDM
jgi:hypothetical protein